VLVLALDSATARCSIALWRDGQVLAAHRPPAAARSDDIPLRAGEMMAQAGLGFDAIERLGVTVGPGRFTGLRAGLAFMRGLALALDRPLVGVTTLAALRPEAECAAREIPLAVIGSGRAELFFRIGDGAPFACVPADLPARLPVGAAIAVVGEETQTVVAALDAAGIAARAVPRDVDAADVATLAALETPGETSPGPLYIHPPAVTAPRERPRAAAVAP
jgi:tRNA threonylcarbamoyladenosine biosynthesis protein TsaB